MADVGNIRIVPRRTLRRNARGQSSNNNLLFVLGLDNQRKRSVTIKRAWQENDETWMLEFSGVEPWSEAEKTLAAMQINEQLRAAKLPLDSFDNLHNAIKAIHQTWSK